MEVVAYFKYKTVPNPFCVEWYTVKPLYCGQHWDKYKCPDYRGVLIISGVNLYYKAQFGTFISVLNTEVSSIEGFHCIFRS